MTKKTCKTCAWRVFENPEKIGVISSPTGAAVQDVLNVLNRRYPVAEVVFAGVQVQGDSAAPTIIDAIKKLNNTDVDESPFIENEVIEETAVENETEITLESIKNEIIKRVDPDGKMNSRQRNKILTKDVIKSLESLEGKQLIDLYDYVFNNKDVSDANVIEIGNLILSKINPDDPRLSKDQETKVNC